MVDKNNNDVMALQEAYANVYNEIVKPDRVFVATQYFRKKWLPLLGASLAWVIVALRQHCYWNRETGEKRDWCLISQEELASEVGISVATLKRLLKHEHADKFIIDITHRYRYDRKRRKQVRRKSMYRIRMDDPLTPEDEVRLKELLAQKLAGLNVNPETGQIDVLQMLDRLSHGEATYSETGLDDLQLNLSGSATEHESGTGQDEIDHSVDELAQRMSRLLSGADGDRREPVPPDEANRSSHGETAYSHREALLYERNATFVPADKLQNTELAPDQVLIAAEGGFLAVSIIDLVKRKLQLSGGQPSEQTRTECFYSVVDALGEGPADWLPEEQERIHLQRRLERELGEQYRQLGAFSLEEALRHYFNPDLAAKFINDASEAELDRIRGWIVYTRQATTLKNPGGFLRSRLESGELPPDSAP